MISCRVSRREYKAQQGRLPVPLPAEYLLRPLLRLHFQVVLSWPRRRWARGRRGARSEWHLRVSPKGPPRPAAPKAGEAGDLQGCGGDRSGAIDHAPPNTQTPRTMAQRVMICDWPLLSSRRPLLGRGIVGTAVGGNAGEVFDTCHMSWTSLMSSIAEPNCRTVISGGLRLCLHARTTGEKTLHDGSIAAMCRKESHVGI